MPPALFEPKHRVSLELYKAVTIKGYISPDGLELGRCADIGYTVPAGSGSGSWTGFNKLMDICPKKCNCRYGLTRGNCGNSKDDPESGLFCSLCVFPGANGHGSVVPGYNAVATIPFFVKPTPGPTLPNIVGLAVGVPDLSTLVAAVQAAGLAATLSSPGPFTVLAPTNAAFAAIQPVVTKLLLPENKALLAKLLTYHVLAGKVLSAAIMNGQSVATVEGQKLCFEKNARTNEIGVFPCGSNDRAALVIKADVLASNGVVHIIDQVLVPPGFIDLVNNRDAMNIVQLAQSTPDLSTLVTAVVAADLTSILSSPGPFTVYAPTNEAFAKLPSATLTRLLKPQNVKELVKVLTYHVIAGTAINPTGGPRGQPIAGGFSRYYNNVAGFPMTVQNACTQRKRNRQGTCARSKLRINPTGKPQPNAFEARAVGSPIIAVNGVIQIIDAVLIPPANDLYFSGVHIPTVFNRINQCAEVNAGPRIPASLFLPQNALVLKEYVDLTIKLYNKASGASIKLSLGRCKDVGYAKLQTSKLANGALRTPNVATTNTWAPAALMTGICKLKCGCDYPTSALNVGTCKDVPDDPSAGTYCSLCGPTFNRPILFNFYDQTDAH